MATALLNELKKTKMSTRAARGRFRSATVEEWGALAALRDAARAGARVFYSHRRRRRMARAGRQHGPGRGGQSRVLAGSDLQVDAAFCAQHPVTACRAQQHDNACRAQQLDNACRAQQLDAALFVQQLDTARCAL